MLRRDQRGKNGSRRPVVSYPGRDDGDLDLGVGELLKVRVIGF